MKDNAKTDPSGRKLKVVIVGGGTAGWMTAAALARAFRGKVGDVELIESAEIGTIGVGEATVPPIQVYNHYLDLDIRDFIQKTYATFKLGIEFQNWTHLGHRYFHQFGPIGMELHGGVAFHHFWLKMQQMGEKFDLEEFSPNAVAAYNGRFTLSKGDEPNPLAYAYHFDASLYALYLRDYAEKRGIKRREGKIVSVQQHPETGFITGVTMADGSEVTGDFFIDCSGFRGLLIEETLKTGYEDWTHWLPCDRAVAVPCSSTNDFHPYTRATAREAGWQWRIPLQHRVGNGHVYCSNFISDDKAADTLMANLDGKALGDPRLLRFTTGRRKKTWNKNVVAIGLSAGFIEPLESTSIHLVQTSIFRLLGLLPLADFDPNTEEEFNRLCRIEMESVRDFVVLHYHAIERTDTELWNYTRTMKVPDSLQYRIDLFRNRGRVARFNEQFLFIEANWVPVMIGQNIVPQQYDPLVDCVDWAENRRILHDIRAVCKEKVMVMPTHKDFIAKHCAAPSVAAMA